MSTASNPEWQKYYDYLDALREKGTTNMFFAGKDLEQYFKLSRQAARMVLWKWMKEFSA